MAVVKGVTLDCRLVGMRGRGHRRILRHTQRTTVLSKLSKFGVSIRAALLDMTRLILLHHVLDGVFRALVSTSTFL